MKVINSISFGSSSDVHETNKKPVKSTDVTVDSFEKKQTAITPEKSILKDIMGRELEGNLTIDSKAALEQLRGVAIFKGQLTIKSDEIDSLAALSSLLRVEGDLIIYDNPKLKSLKGLEHLMQVTGKCHVKVVPIKDLTGLTSLQQCHSFGLFSCEQLKSTKGLNSFKKTAYVSLNTLPACDQVKELVAATITGSMTIDEIPNVDLGPFHEKGVKIERLPPIPRHPMPGTLFGMKNHWLPV